MFGTDSERFAGPRVVTLFIRLTNTAKAPRSTARKRVYGPCRGKKSRGWHGVKMKSRSCLAGLGVEKVENLTRAFGTDAGNLAEIGHRCPLDFLQGTEVMQQSTFA